MVRILQSYFNSFIHHSIVESLKMSTTISIADLHANVINCSVKGLIIGKSNMSTFPKRTNGQQEPSLGSVVKFLIRDSCEDYINLTVWGSQQFIETYDQQFTIGHVINVLRCTIGNIRQDERFSPITSSQYQLTINEGIGFIELNEDDDGAKIAKLINVPLKSLDLALNLADIITNRPTSDWLDLVDLVVVVAKLKPTKQSGTKNVRDLIVIDQTLPGMFLTIWNGAWIDKSELSFGSFFPEIIQSSSIHRSNSWSEMTTILHLINVGFKYSDFHKSIVLVALSRTIIVVDPIGERATSLRQYTKNSTLILSDIDTSEPDLSTIQTVMTIQQIIDRLNDPASDSVFYSLTYAIVTQMDLDGCTLISSRRW